MTKTSEQNLQILREIDKLDRIGLDGVCAMLGEGMEDSSGAFNPGVGLLPIQVSMIRYFLEGYDKEKTNEEALDEISEKLDRLSKVKSRIDLMTILEDTIVNLETGETYWDRFISMNGNEDETWSKDGRPKNIGWALDDLIEGLKQNGA